MGSSTSRALVTDPRELASEEWDYIVVGSGPAGCVLANRLSQDSKNRVLLVESGGNNETEMYSKIPITWPRTLHTHADWDYTTTEQPELGGRTTYWPRGHLLGGSSSINAMMYQHAPPDDLDEWERLGAEGWNAKSMGPYYRKAEFFTPSSHHVDTIHENRGNTGTWNTGYISAHPMSDSFVESCTEAGIPLIPDFNTPKGPMGVSHLTSFISPDGNRSSGATAYLPPSVRARPNLTIAIGTRCTKLLLSPSSSPSSPDSLTCTGVELSTSSDSPRTSVHAKKEVLLCCGSIGSPQVLMCSGIGPEDALKKAGVDVLRNAPQVGQNMKDHLAAFLLFRAKASYDWLGHPVLGLFPLIQHILFGTGPLTTNAGEAAAFVRLDRTRPMWDTKLSTQSTEVTDTSSGPGAPDVEFIGAPLTFYRHAQVPPAPGDKSFTLGVVHLRPLSEGYISVSSGSTWDKAVIEPNYLTNKVDVAAIVRGIRAALLIAHTSPLASQLEFRYDGSNTDISNMYWIGDQDPETLTDETIEKWLRQGVETLYHPVSTCRIARTAEEGVVDSNLRVFGVKNLRVVDASVFPNQIAAHTTATVIALGERAADLIIGGVA